MGPRTSRRVLALAALPLLAATQTSAAQQLPPYEQIFARQRVPTGLSSPWGLSVGDVNGDGLVDAFVGGGDPDGGLSCIPGGPGTTFGLPVVTLTGSTHLGAGALGDWDADGQLDALSSGYVGQQYLFAVVHGDGTGAFSIGQTIPVPSVKEAGGAVGDVNGDGLLDLLSTHSAGVGRYLGAGSGLLGGLQLLPLVATGSAYSQQVRLADMDGDSDLDIVCSFLIDVGAASGTNGVGLLRGDGAGGFTLAEISPIDDSIAPSISLGDHEGDGDTDVFYSYSVSSVGPNKQLGLCLNDGAGNLTVQPKFPVGTNGSGGGLVCADVNGDGLLDAITFHAVQDSNDSPMWISHLSALGASTGNQNFSPVATPGGVAIADVNADGVSDVLLVDFSSTGNMAMLLSDGAGGFLGPEVHMALQATEGTLLDFDGDGDTDALLAVGGGGPGTGGLGIWRSGDIGTESWTLKSLGYYPEGFGVGDINADGELDAALCDLQLGKVSFLLGTGAGQFAAPLTYTPLGAPDLAVGDVNEDGFADVLTADGSFAALTIFPGSASGHPVPTAITTTFEDPEQLELVDMDEDGHLDAVYGQGFTTSGGSGLAVKLGNGNGTFSASIPGPVQVSVLIPLASFVVGDLDSDGHLDLVHVKGKFVTPLLGDGTGHLTAALPAPSIVMTGLNWYPTLADVNGDGRLDLLAGEHPSSDTAFKLMLGDGAGSFGPPTYFSNDRPTNWIGVANMDGDGKPDVVFSRLEPFPAQAEGVQIYTNLGPAHTWTNLGHALAGSFDTPSLNGTGVPSAGNTVHLAIDGMKPLTATTLVIGLGVLNAPFKGGVMVPAPFLLIPGLPLDADGFFELSALWPAGLPSGLQVAYQAWQSDAGGPKGFSATNGLVSLSP